MAVAKSRKSRSRRNMRRNANSALAVPALSVDRGTGETNRFHHVSPQGYYKGREVIARNHTVREEQDEE
ncbi:MAG: rpmF [Gammaproteobacteria bacterium]|nr:rpmF [Gammaproteobacteria bacterium]